MTTQYLFYILFGYLSGSVLYGYLLPKYIKKIDVTKESPDQNPGVANAFLCAGAPIGFCAHFFRSVVTFAIFWGMVIIKRGPLGITAGTGILSFVVIWKHLVKYQNERLEITFPGRQEKV